MAKKLPPIRLDEKTRKEYAKLMKNAKAKVRNVRKNYGINLDGVVDVKPIESFTTRAEYNEWRDKAQSFTNRANLNYQFRKNQYGVVATKKEINETIRNTKQAQRIAEKLQKEAVNKPFISGGKVQGTVGQRMLQMGKPETAGIVRPPDFNFNKMHTKQQYQKKKKNMEERSDPEFFDKRLDRLKKNFIKLLEGNFNSDADNLIEKIRNIPNDDFYEIFLDVDEFDFTKYDSLNEGGFNDDGKLMRMEDAVDDYFSGKFNLDLKGF